MTTLTRTQNDILYNRLRLIKGQSKYQLKCQERTVRVLTSSGFAVEVADRFNRSSDYSKYYLNQSLDIDVIKFDKEKLLSVWLEETPSTRSPYKLYNCPPMWTTLEFPDGLVLFTRPSTQISEPNTQEKTEGISYQFQLDGKWIGQGHFCSFEHFETEIAPALQSDIDYLRRIAS